MARMISSCRRSMASGYLERAARPRDGFLQVMLVQLDADEAHPELRAGDGRRPEAEEGISHHTEALEAVQPEAQLRQFWRKRGGMRPILFATLNRLVGNEPGVAAAADTRRRPSPAADVGLVLIFHADRLTLERSRARRREM